MHILCVSAQLSGHLDWGGYTETAVALQQRGHEVLWTSGAAVRPLLQARGLPFHVVEQTGWRWPPPPPMRPDPAADHKVLQEHRQRRSLDQWLDVERVSAATVELMAVVERFQPDLIVSEMFVASAGLVAEKMGVPFVVAGWPAPSARAAGADQPVWFEARARLETLLDRFALRGLNWTDVGPPALSSPHLHVTYWSERWYGVEASPPTHHVGGLAKEAEGVSETSATERPLSETEPAVLITLGTSFNDDPDFFVAAAIAASELGATPLIVLGRAPTDTVVRPLRDRLPHSARLYAMLDLHAVLPNVAAAIHHGGAGTTHALVTHAVPQVVVPHAADQHRQAQGVARTEIGFHISPRQASSDNLTKALALLMPDRSAYREHAYELCDEFAALGGVNRAADLLEHLVN